MEVPPDFAWPVGLIPVPRTQASQRANTSRQSIGGEVKRAIQDMNDGLGREKRLPINIHSPLSVSNQILGCVGRLIARDPVIGRYLGKLTYREIQVKFITRQSEFHKACHGIISSLAEQDPLVRATTNTWLGYRALLAKLSNAKNNAKKIQSKEKKKLLETIQGSAQTAGIPASTNNIVQEGVQTTPISANPFESPCVQPHQSLLTSQAQAVDTELITDPIVRVEDAMESGGEEERGILNGNGEGREGPDVGGDCISRMEEDYSNSDDEQVNKADERRIKPSSNDENSSNDEEEVRMLEQRIKDIRRRKMKVSKTRNIRDGKFPNKERHEGPRVSFNNGTRGASNLSEGSSAAHLVGNGSTVNRHRNGGKSTTVKKTGNSNSAHGNGSGINDTGTTGNGNKRRKKVGKSYDVEQPGKKTKRLRK